jgi:hypothetical protein
MLLWWTDPVPLLLAMVLPFGLDPGPFQRIVNVHWAGGLAVEFGPRAQDA